jgi:hypothetical protein
VGDAEWCRRDILDEQLLSRLVKDHSDTTLTSHGLILRDDRSDLKDITRILAGVLEDVVELKAVSHSH